MVDRADPDLFGAVWCFGDFRKQLNAGSVYLQSVLSTEGFHGSGRMLRALLSRNKLSLSCLTEAALISMRLNQSSSRSGGNAKNA